MHCKLISRNNLEIETNLTKNLKIRLCPSNTRKHTKNHTGHAADEIFETEWLPYVTNSIEFWRGFHIYFKNQYKPHQVLFTRYEDFHENLIGELQRILHFLGFHMSEDIQKCVENRKEGLYHRKRTKIDQSNYYNAEQKVVISAVRDETYAKIGLKKRVIV